MKLFKALCVGLIAITPVFAKTTKPAPTKKPIPVKKAAPIRKPTVPNLSAEATFTDIYNRSEWKKSAGSKGSGDGSSLASTQQYRDFLQNFLETFQIRSVVDAGCGDWEFSKAMDWSQVDYTGCDVVRSVIEKNQELFTSSNIHFLHQDIIAKPLPPADLLICKDVLQHLPNADILTFMKQFSNFKYCLITNDVSLETLSSSNLDAARGACRTVDLTKPPFNQKGIKVLNFVSPSTVAPTVKQILLIIREDAEA